VKPLPSELMQSLNAFQESRILLSAIELNVFTAVGRGATSAQVAAKIRCNARATEMLLNALAAIGMLKKRAGIFRNAPLAAEFLVEGAASDSRRALLHTVGLWDRWSNLTECVRTGTAVGHEEIGKRGSQWIEAFIAAMHRRAEATAPALVKAIGTQGVARMLDVGGGSGVYAIAFAQANPSLAAEILDLKPVLPIARRHIRKAGLQGRVKAREGNLERDALGEGYDLILLSAVCHMLGPEGNQDLFRRAFTALAPGGRIVVKDFILEADKTAPRWAAVFSLNMLVGTPRGSDYSKPEYAEWLRKAGFGKVRYLAVPGVAEMMVGVK
jgi:predicted O-methyltransferase YrrM